MYSPPRVTAEIIRSKNKHVLLGFALDLTVLDPDDGMPWDFLIASKREKARAMRRTQQPYMLIGSPECTQFSQIQALNMARSTDPSAFLRARTAAIVHIDFMVELYREQLEDGHYFLHEHPRWATSCSFHQLRH